MNKNSSIYNIVTEIYLIIMILIFPLVMNDTHYYHILECKWNFYIIVSWVYIFITLIIYFSKLIILKENFFKDYKIKSYQILILIFIFILIVSTCFSPYINNYNLLIGVYRNEGLITYITYSLSFLFITLFLKPNERHIVYICILSIILSIIGIFQHFGINIFNLYVTKEGLSNGSYIITIGNIDTVSSLYVLLISIFCSLYIFFKNDKKLNILELLSIFLGTFVIFFMNVSSGLLALLLIVILSIPVIIKNSDYLKKLLLIASIVSFSYLINKFIIISYTDVYDLVIKLNYKCLVLLIIPVILFSLSKLKFNYLIKNNNYYKYSYIILFLLIIFGLSLIYIIDFKNGIIYELHELLHGNFDDNFGTYRIFLWKRTIPLLKDYFWVGSGPDTFGLRFMAKYTQDVIELGSYTNQDTAANVYLTMMGNIGFLGLTCYLSLIFSIVKKLFEEKKYLLFLIPIVCYMIQDFFNLWVVIVTPLWWVFLGYVCSCMEFNLKIKNKKGKK